MRRRASIYAFWLAAALLVVASAPARAGLTTDLAGYWQLDGNGTDASGNSRDLTVVGTGGYAAGLLDQALNLPGSTADYAIRGADDAAFDFGAGDFTVQAWVYYNSTAGEQVAVEKLDGPSSPGWSLTKITNNTFLLHTSGTPNLTGNLVGITTGQWHHLVVRRDGADAELFFDNDSIGTANFGTGSISDTARPLLLGKRNDGDGRGFAMNGRLDEVAIWTRALSNEEIGTLYNEGNGLVIPEPATVALLGLGGLALAIRRRR